MQKNYMEKNSNSIMMNIEDSLKAYRDVQNSIDTALEQGRAEGIEGKLNEKQT